MKQAMPAPEHNLAGGGTHVTESPKAPMEFLSRAWTLPAPTMIKQGSTSASSSSSVPEDLAASLRQFSFASSATSQFVLDRIMSQSVNEISPLTSGRLSHSSGPLTGPGGFLGEDSSPASPSEEFEDVVKYFRSHNSLQPLFTDGRSLTNAGGGHNNGCNTPTAAAVRGKTVGRWLKERKEKKKEETRAHNAQLHAAVSVAAVASAVAAIAAGTAASGRSARLDMALASAATLVAAQCVEAAEGMGAERGHLGFVVSSAVNVRSHDDIATLTAAAATALRGAATLKARALKEVWNAATVIPLDRGTEKEHSRIANRGRGTIPEADLLGVFNEELLSRGSELLKRTRQGDLHWKVVSVYIHRTGQVMLKMKSKLVAGTITKKKKNVVLEVCKNMPAWPGRHLIDGGDERRYFGLRTEARGVVEFECRNQREYDMWTQGVSRLLFIVASRRVKRSTY